MELQQTIAPDLNVCPSSNFGIFISTFSCHCARGLLTGRDQGLAKPTVVAATRWDSGVRTARTGEATAGPKNCARKRTTVTQSALPCRYIHCAWRLGKLASSNYSTLQRRTSSYTLSTTGSPRQVFLPWNPSWPHLKGCTVHMDSSCVSFANQNKRAPPQDGSQLFPLSVKNVPFQIGTFPFQI